MIEDHSIWGLIGGIIGSAATFLAKSVWDNAIQREKEISLAIWKIKADEMEKRLSTFYWPLYMCLQRDDLMWKKVFSDLRMRSDAPKAWVKNLSEEDRKNLSSELENNVLIPNHKDAVDIIRSKMYISAVTPELARLLFAYVRHVDGYIALRSAGIKGIDPIDIEEKYPEGLSAAVKARLDDFQAAYEKLLREKELI